MQEEFREATSVRRGTIWANERHVFHPCEDDKWAVNKSVEEFSAKAVPQLERHSSRSIYFTNVGIACKNKTSGGRSPGRRFLPLIKIGRPSTNVAPRNVSYSIIQPSGFADIPQVYHAAY